MLLQRGNKLTLLALLPWLWYLRKPMNVFQANHGLLKMSIGVVVLKV